MRRFSWTCAAGVLALACACDTENRGPEVAERAAIEAALEGAPEPSEPTDEEDCNCDRGCGEHDADAHVKVEAAAERELAKPLDVEQLQATVRDDRPAQGPRDAKIEIMVFNDFECPFCRKEVAVLEEVLAAYPDDVRVVFKQMPLPMHSAAVPAARASLAAHRQGKFWEMHDALFEQPERVRKGELSAIAGDIGLDVEQFERDLEDPEIAAQVDRDADDARELGIRGTPSMVVGDKLVVGAQPLVVLREVIDAQLAI